MIHVAAFSGGKDSTALLCWLKEQGIEFTAIFADTGWESPLTYAYVEQINQLLLGGRLIRVKSEKYDGFKDLVIQRRRIPGARSRFCTDELKVFPLHKWIEAQDDEVTVYQGVRADESASRSRMTPSEWVDAAGGYQIERPLFRWTAEQCFEITKKHGISANPLYLVGAGRVGCFPCIMVSLRELKCLIRAYPEIKQKLIDLESAMAQEHPDLDSTFFRVGTIPERYCTKPYTAKDGRVMMVPRAEDVFRYLESVDEDQLPLFETPKCLSVYNLCE